MDILYWLFFIIMGGSAFTLRGIWGHQLGGGVMGVLIGLSLSFILDLPLSTTIILTFWLAITWAICATIGWARYKTIQRFFRGYIVYAAIPNFVMGLILFPNNWAVIMELTFLGALGMGIGFGSSYQSLTRIRDKMAADYAKKNPDGKTLNWGDRPLEDGEIRHIYVFYFDTWKILLEIFSGALYGITTLLVFSRHSNAIDVLSMSLNGWHYFMTFICFIFLPLALMYGVLEEKLNKVKEKSTEEQVKLTKEKFINIAKISIIAGIICAIIFYTYLEFFMAPILILLIAYWVINILAKVYNPFEAKLFKADCLLDMILGIIITVFIFLITA
jgi:hypothetical protein